MSTEFINDQWRLPNAWNGTESNVNKQSNYSMDFDGVANEYVVSSLDGTGGSSSSFGSGSDLNLTITFWFKLSQLTSAFGMLSWATTPAAGGGLLLFVQQTSTGTVQVYIVANGAGYRYVSSNLTVDTWYNLTFTRTASDNTWRFYLNSTLDSTTYTDNGTVSGQSSATNFYIGSGFGGSGNFNGSIDAVAIYNYALSSSQITTLYGSSSTGIGNPMSLSPKPIAYYPLGDQDAFNGADYLVPNSSLKDYVFDFSSDNIEVDSIGSLFSGITNFSFSGWFNLTSFGGQQVFNILEGNNWKFGINTFNNQLRFLLNPGVAYIANLQNITSTNTWFHYAGVFDGSGASDTDRLKLYINGQPQTVTYNTTTPTSFPTLLSTADISIGGTLSPFNGMTGKASNIQLWTSSLTLTEIETLYNNGSPYTGTQPQNSNLQGWWKLDASDTYDSSTGNWTIEDHAGSNDGTSYGMNQANLVQSDLSFTSGYSPYALDFDGTNERVDTSNISALDNATQFTISTWAYWNTTGNTNEWLFMAANSYKTIRVQFELENQKIYFHFRGATGDVRVNMINSDWVNVVAVFDTNAASADKMIIYLNGERATNIAYTEPTGNSPTGMTIANIGGRTDGYGFDGRISNFSIWNAALTSSQVTEIYNEGVPSNLNNHSAYSNLVSWWQLGSNSSFNTNWTVLDEKGSNNGTSANMTEDAIVDGVGSYANGLSSGMGGDEVIGSAPFSDANSLSVNMDVLDRVEDTPS